MPSWDLGGNSGISSSNFLGTTDVRPLVMKTNGAEAMRLTPGGKVAIGGLGDRGPPITPSTSRAPSTPTRS